MKRIIELILVLIICSGCSTGITRASEIVANAYHVSYREICDMASMIRIRENVCECDPALKYEALLYGQWRHVNILGSDNEINAMSAAIAGDGAYCFYMSSGVYTSKHGQQFHQLRVCDVQEMKSLLSQ